MPITGCHSQYTERQAPGVCQYTGYLRTQHLCPRSHWRSIDDRFAVTATTHIGVDGQCSGVASHDPFALLNVRILISKVGKISMSTPLS
jgi:hypothetical protein